MRIVTAIAFMLIVTTAKSQTFLPGSFMDNSYRGNFGNVFHLDDSSTRKWSFSRYAAVSSSFTFFRGGNAAIFSIPVGLQLNRRLTNNLYAFANVSLAPAYINFNRSFATSDFNKGIQNNNFLKTGSLSAYSRAALGLMYVNDEKTFSISGSIGVERSSYPFPQYNQMNNNRVNGFNNAY